MPARLLALMMSGSVISGLIVMALLALLTSCTPAPHPVKIAGLFSSTGYAAFAGQAAKDGFLMAIEDSGMNISYEVMDFGSDQQRLADDARRLIDNHDIVILGPEWNEFGQTVAPIASDNHVLFISPWMTGEDAWVTSSPYYLSATSSDRSNIRAIIKYLLGNNMTRLVTVYDDNEFSKENIAILEDELHLYPQIQVLDRFKVTQDATDYTAQVDKIKIERPDAIYAVVATDTSESALNEQLAKSQVTSQIFIPFSRGASTFFLRQAGKYATGTIYPAIKERKTMDAFKQKYRARFGREPSAISAATSYDMTTLVLDAIRKGATTSEEVTEYMRHVNGYSGYMTDYTYNPNHHLGAEEIILKRITASGEAVPVS